MTGRDIRISIVSALNSAGIEATKQQVNSMAKSVKASMADAANGNKKHWADIKAAWDMGCQAIQKAWQGVTAGLRSAFHFETQTTQFKTLVGNIDEAKRHMADLKELGDTPPFGLDEFAQASRSLMVMTDGALGYKKSLELIGDAAAATGYPIEELGQAVGRMYAFIRDGQPLSRAVMQLRNMGVITPEVAQKLQDLQAAGASNAEIWAEVEAQLGRYKGAMAETEKTGEGLIGAIQSRWDNIVRQFGKAWEEAAKGGMHDVLEAAKAIEEDGSVEVWATKTCGWLQKVADGAVGVAKVIGNVVTPVWKAITSTAEATAQAVGNAWGTLAGGGNFADAAKAAWRGWEEGANDVWDFDGAQADADKQAKADRAAKIAAEKAKKDEDAAKREAEERNRMAKSLADGEAKAKERAEEEAARKAYETWERAAQNYADKQGELAKKAEAERERLAQKELDRRIKDLQTLKAADEKAEADLRSEKANAESALQRAWSWYLDKDSMKAQLEAEKKNAEAEKQFEKDFARLKHRGINWRKAENLTVDEEAVRRVAIAREARDEADRHLAEIERNTSDLAAKIDELLELK